MEENYFESEAFIMAKSNWDTKGYLGVTAEDHEGIHSTPDEILNENPGKTLGELMSDQEILEYIEGTKKNIEENEGIEKMKRFNEDLKDNLKLTIEYLRSIDRLPENI